MNKGFYLAASAMMIQERRLNSVSNNLANINTAGFRRERMGVGTFNEVLNLRIQGLDRTIIGSSENLQTISTIEHYFDQANVTMTNNPLDVAIIGDGFFAVTSNGQSMLTRNGSFSIDEQGFLVTNGNQRVQGDRGDIFLGTDRIQIDDYGVITTENGQFIDQLSLVSVEDLTLLNLQSNGLFTSDTPVIRISGRVVQGSLEGSNVELTSELTAMMEIQRHFQSVANALRVIDRLNERAVNEIARV